MSDLQAMTNHANQDSRCEQNDPRPEGIAAEKMTLITSKWGATWGDIYSIIFPGAPVPSPCKSGGILKAAITDPFQDHEDVPPERPGEQSPQSQELASFEAYARVELPRLVEANLQTVINAELAPLEESLRVMLVDIVRRCQSTVAQNYNRFQSATAFDSLETNNEAPATMLSLGAEQTADSDSWANSQYGQSLSLEGRRLVENDTTNLFEEPPFLNLPESDPIPLELDSFTAWNVFSDSGYGSQSGRYCTCRQEGEDYNGKSGI